jgi:hypothetical protein
MKRLRILGLSLLALFALGALAASSSSALEGLLPLNQSFTVLAKTMQFETANKEKVTCGETKGNGKAENNSNTHGTVTLDFLKCEILGFPSFSLGEKEPKEIKEALILIEVLYLICLLANLVFHIFLTIDKPVHIVSPTFGILVNLTGSFIGTLLTVKGKLFVVDFKGKEGKQENATECKDEAGNVKKAELLSEKDPEKALKLSLNAEDGLLQFEKEVELMDK